MIIIIEGRTWSFQGLIDRNSKKYDIVVLINLKNVKKND